MHRTEGTNNVNNLFTSGPPGTNVAEPWLNAVQEEICYTIEQAGLPLKTAATDTRDQLKTAIELLSLSYVGFSAGTKMYFYQDAAPSGWTIDGTTADALLAVKGGAVAYNAAGGTQQGTWTQPNHTHAVGTYTINSHNHGVGTYQSQNHQHGVGSYQMPQHLHGVGSLAFPNHQHVFDSTATVSKSTTLVGQPATLISPTTATQVEIFDWAAGATTLYWIKSCTKTDGGGSVTGQTSNTGPTSITGSSDTDGLAAITGISASTIATMAGNSAGDNTASTWRPLAQVGIIATKN